MFILAHVLPLLATHVESEGTAMKITLNDGTILLCLQDELARKLAATEVGEQMAKSLKLDIYRFNQRTTVAHLEHLPTGDVYVGYSICDNPDKFSRRVGQDKAARSACEQFISAERHHRKWLVRNSQTQPST